MADESKQAIPKTGPDYGTVAPKQDGGVEADGSHDDPDVAESDNESGEEARNRCCKCCENCTINRHMLPVKLFYFFFFGARGAVTPYLSIYFKQLGLSPDQIGLVTGMRPIVGFGSGLVWGAFSDKFKVRKICLIVSMIGWLIFTVGLGFVNKPRRTQTCPNVVNDTMTSSKRSVITGPNAMPRTLALPPLPLQTEVANSIEVSKHPTRGQEAELQPSGVIGRKLLYHLFEPTFDHHLKAKKNKTKTHQFRRHRIRHRHDTYYRKEMRENLSWLYEESTLFKTVIVLILLVVVGELVQAPTSPLADAATIEMLGEKQISMYGHQRAWGAVGFGLSAFLVGLLLSYSRKQIKICGILLVFSDYMIVFYFFAAAMAVALLCGCAMDYKCPDEADDDSDTDGEEGKHNTSNVFRLFMSVHYASWLSTSYFMGVCNGVIWGFLYWHLENLGATQLLLGVVSILTYACEFTMFFFVDNIIKPFGYIGTLYLALLCYAVRFTIYALIRNPWLVIPAELLQGLTFSSVWTSLTRYACSAVPKASLATVQGILHGVYWGLGVGTGHLTGGLLIDNFGAEATFIALAVGCIIVLALFAVAQKFSEKPAPLRGSSEHQTFEQEKAK